MASVINWVASSFPAHKNFSLTSPPPYIGYDLHFIISQFFSSCFFAFFAFQHVVSQKFTPAERFLIWNINCIIGKEHQYKNNEITNFTIFPVVYSFFFYLLFFWFFNGVFHCIYLRTNLELKETLISLCQNHC